MNEIRIELNSSTRLIHPNCVPSFHLLHSLLLIATLPLDVRDGEQNSPPLQRLRWKLFIHTILPQAHTLVGGLFSLSFLSCAHMARFIKCLINIFHAVAQSPHAEEYSADEIWAKYLMRSCTS